MRSILLKNADFVVQDRDKVIRDASVYVEGGVIQDVGPAMDINNQHKADMEFDCRGHIVIPGLINSHNHLYEISQRGLGKDYPLDEWIKKIVYPVNQMLTGDDYYWLELMACADAARNGTTAIVEMMTSFARFHADRGVEAFLDFGMRGAVARSSSNRSRISDAENRPPEEDYKATAEFIDRWRERASPLVKPWVGPSMTITCEPSFQAELKRLAKEKGVKYHVHLAETAGITKAARDNGYLGDVALAYAHGLLDENTVIAHAVWVTDIELEMVKLAGAQIVHNPSSNQVLADGAAPVARMVAKGITVGLGTDGPSSNDSLDMVAEMKSCVKLSRVSTLNTTVLSSKQVFEMATLGGATILGYGNLGKLYKGFLADIACFRMRRNPSLYPVYDPIDALVYYGSGRDNVLTIIGGKVVYYDGSWPTIDVDKGMEKLDDICERVRGLLRIGADR
ncbi:5-methylthioadenosine/S-adenosylhomocysteine deaminase [archaeon HR01]|nr:5-methylthioadenosine/S-adenosylhomocysteine deaminase [archaeon HR01]